MPAGDEKSKLPLDPSKAIEHLMDQYGSIILRTAYYYLNDKYHAEDISQEVFLRAYRNWNKFRKESHVKTWLIKITINLCKDQLGLKSSTEKPVEEVFENHSSHSEVEKVVLDHMRNSDVLKYVYSLPDVFREVIYLYYYLEFSTKEIAEATSFPEGTIRSRLYRARTELGKKLKKEAWY